MDSEEEARETLMDGRREDSGSGYGDGSGAGGGGHADSCENSTTCTMSACERGSTRLCHTLLPGSGTI